MRYRTFGRNNGLRVSEIALGTGRFGPLLGADKTETRGVLDAFLDAGGTFIDTAEGYQSGHSEEWVGEFVAGRRDDLVIASKYSVGLDRTEGHARKGNSRKAMMAAIDGTLRRLRTDYVDLYWLHAVDGVTPMLEILDGLDDLIRAGKVRYGGLNNFPAWRVSRGVALTEQHHLAPIAAISVEYGLAERSAERELLPMAEALGLGVGAWSPLSSSFLSSDYDGDPAELLHHWPGTGRPRAADHAVRDAALATAQRLGVSVSEVALAWLVARAADSTTSLVPILGARTAQQLTQTLGALELELAPEERHSLDEAGGFLLGEPHDHNRFHETLTTAEDLVRPAVPVA